MLKIKKNDTVTVIAGKNKGASGKVILVDAKNGRVTVEKVNIITKHVKPTQAGKKGERIKVEAPIHISNVMLIDPSSKKRSRIGFEISETGEKSRVYKKSGKKVS